VHKYIKYIGTEACPSGRKSIEKFTKTTHMLLFHPWVLIRNVLLSKLPYKAMYGNTTYRHKYVTVSVKVGTKFLNKDRTDNCHIKYSVEEKTFLPKGCILHI
jgi:hypothetical protein